MRGAEPLIRRVFRQERLGIICSTCDKPSEWNPPVSANPVSQPLSEKACSRGYATTERRRMKAPDEATLSFGLHRARNVLQVSSYILISGSRKKPSAYVSHSKFPRTKWRVPPPADVVPFAKGRQGGLSRTAWREVLLGMSNQVEWDRIEA
jgi:hypothetical protein